MQQMKGKKPKLQISMDRSQRKKQASSPLTSMTKSKKKQVFQQQPSKQLSNISSPSKQISISMGSPMQVDSPNRARKKQTFITQPRKINQVEIAYCQLNNYIDKIDEKIEDYIQRNQAEFLIAYRNHIKRVREQMDEITRKALQNADSSVSQTEKIQRLQKQLIIFRDQSLKLFEKVTDQQKKIYSLNSKIKQLQNQNQYMQRSVKNLTKRNKQLEGERYQQNFSQKQLIQQNNQLKQFRISRPSQRVNLTGQQNSIRVIDIDKYLQGSSTNKTRPYTTAINSKGASVRSRIQSVQLSRLNQRNLLIQQQITQINSKLQDFLKPVVDNQLINKIKQSISQILKNYQNQEEQLNKQLTEKHRLTQMSKGTRKSYLGMNSSVVTRNSKSFVQHKNMARRSQLQQYFFKSIEEVKKQITRRKGLKSINFYSQYANMSINEFKKVDFFRLLQLLLSHDKAVLALHKALFQQQKIYK